VLRETFTGCVDSLGPSLVRVKLDYSQLRELETVSDVLADLVHVFAELSSMELHLSLKVSNARLHLLEFSLSSLSAAVDALGAVTFLHNLKPTFLASLLSELAGGLVDTVVFAEVLPIASEVRTLDSLVEALESVLVDLPPWDFLIAALGLVFASDLQLLELVENIRMRFAYLESFEVAARTGDYVLGLSLIHT